MARRMLRVFMLASYSACGDRKPPSGDRKQSIAERCGGNVAALALFQMRDRRLHWGVFDDASLGVVAGRNRQSVGRGTLPT
jgi:hypothetical protein